MLIGYARVSTEDQNLALQRAALTEAGCTRIFEEKVSGAARARIELTRLLEHLRDGDVIVVVRLDRLARSTKDLLTLAEEIAEHGAGLRSLGEPWADTTTPAGKMVLTVFAGIAEFERSLILQRTGAGRAAALARGVKFGRPAKIREDQWDHYGPLLRRGEISVPTAAKLIGCGRATLYRRLAMDSRRSGAAPPLKTATASLETSVCLFFGIPFDALTTLILLKKASSTHSPVH